MLPGNWDHERLAQIRRAKLEGFAVGAATVIMCWIAVTTFYH